MIRNIVRIAITAIVALALVISIIPATAPVRVLAAAGDVPNKLMIVYYGSYDEQGSTVTILRNAQPKYLVVNTANGYWENISTFPSDQINTFQSSYGINIIGYTTCSYTNRSIDLVKGEIAKMAEIDGVKGVFLDECEDGEGNPKQLSNDDKLYYRQITEFAHTYNLIIWANLGVNTFDPWLLGSEADFTFIGSSEQWDDAALTDVQKEGRNKITVLRWFEQGTTLPKITSAQDAYDLTQAAWEKGLAFCYINNDNYTNLPDYFSSYIDMLWDVPVVDTFAASAGSTSATLGGNLIDKRGASSVTVSFEWGTTNDYGNTTSTQSLSSNGTFTQTISNLTANTRYYFRAKAVSGSYTNWGSEGWFQTLAGEPPPETVDDLTVNTSMTTPNSISLNWTAPHEDYNDGNSGPAAEYDVRYSTSTITSGNWNEAHQVTGEPAPGNPGSTDTFTVDELNPSTTYYIALKTADTNPDNWSGLSNVVYETTDGVIGGQKPEVITQPATLVTSTTANVNGNLLSLGDSTVVSLSFLYDDDQSGEYDFVQSLGTVSATGEFSLTVSNLIPKTTYYFKARAVSEYGEDLGSELSFDTLGTPYQEIIKDVEAGADDGFSGTWAFSNTATWYEAGSPGSGATYGAWFRFRNVEIPDGAIIDEAYLTLLQTQWDANTHLKIRAEDAANPSAPADTSDHASRSRTSTGVDWDAGYGDYNWHASPDLAGVIQELVDSYDYSGGSSAIQILIDDDSSSASNEHIGQTYEANTAPQLHITYHVVPNAIDKEVSAGADDGFSGTWAYANNTTWYEAGSPAPGGTYSAWFRFTNITIPSGAVIDEAYMSLFQTRWAAGAQLQIRAEDAANPSAPSSLSDHVSRIRTGTGLYWTSGGYGDYAWHDTPNFASVIQELVQSYTLNGSAIQIFLDDYFSYGGAEAVGQTYESNNVPQLHIRYHVDETPPSAVNNLAVDNPTPNSLRLTWTAPGNDGNLGTAAQYDIRYSSSQITDQNWSSASQISGEPSPQSPGTSQTFTISGLTPNTAYYFALKTSDSIPNWSAISNSPNGTTSSTGGSFTKSITSGADDGFSGSWAFSSDVSWYEAGSPGSGATYDAWFRFTSINIPSGATIDEAYLTLAQGQWETGTHLKIFADDAANPSAPKSTSHHSSKTRTTNGVDWDSGYGDYYWHPTPDIKTVIQELVNSYDYSGGTNAILILIDDDGSDTSAEHIGQTFESGLVPTLFVRYH